MRKQSWIILALSIVFVASPFFGLPGWSTSLATVVAFLAVSLLGLNLIFGNTGMLAFGQAAFVALPGYVAGILSNLGAPTIVAIAAALLGTVLVANIMGRIFIRLPGIFFAVGTLGFAFVVEGLARAFPSITGGASGLVFAEGTALSSMQWYAIAVVALAAAMSIYAASVRSGYARTLMAVQYDELAAEVAGIDVTKVKIRAFTYGSAYCAVGGLLLAYFVGVLVPENAGVNRSLEFVGMVMLGGAGSVAGPLLGALVVQWLFAVAGAAKQYEVLIYGIAFLGTVLFAREGLAAIFKPFWRMPREAPGSARPAPEASRSILHANALEQGLSVKGISKRFGGVQAITDVSFDVKAGEILAIVGPNGAGKTTLFNIVSGIEMPNTGSVYVDGEEMTFAAVHTRATKVGRSFQVARLIPRLTAAENVMVRLDQISPELGESQRHAAALALFDSFKLLEIADTRASALSAGQRKLVDIVRATVGSPGILLLDEPAVGLTASELAQLSSLLRSLRDRGCGIVLVEHNMEFVKDIASKGVVLHGGVLIASGEVAEILRNPEVVDAYLGVM